MVSRLLPVLLVTAACATRAAPAPPAPRAPPPPARCELVGAPEVVRAVGTATLWRYDTDDLPVFYSETLPDDAGYRAFRDAIRHDGAELRVPIADRAPVTDDHMREIWRREDHNADLVYRGAAGSLHPIHCLEAILLARQHARYSELTHPTEVIVMILRRHDGERARLRLYVGAGDQLFPPHDVYGLDEARVDVAAGWHLDTVLHNHTVQHRGERYALGAPALSTNDIVFARNVVDELHLAGAWVTNGVYTVEIPAADFPQFLGADGVP